MKDKKIIVSVVIVCVVVLVVGFVSGVAYEKNKLSKSGASSFTSRFVGQGNFNPNGRTGTSGNVRTGGNGFLGGAVLGQVISQDSKSLTVKLRDGGSRIVLISPSTKVEKTVDGVMTDVSVGKQVMITGQVNSDGSVSATSIQIRPDIPIQKNQATN